MIPYSWVVYFLSKSNDSDQKPIDIFFFFFYSSLPYWEESTLSKCRIIRFFEPRIFFDLGSHLPIFSEKKKKTGFFFIFGSLRSKKKKKKNENFSKFKKKKKKKMAPRLGSKR